MGEKGGKGAVDASRARHALLTDLSTMCLRERPPALTSVLLMGKRVLVAMMRLDRFSGFFFSHEPM